MLKTSYTEEKLRSVIGPQNLRDATFDDVVRGVQPRFVAEPDDERQLASLLATANQERIAVVPRGGGTKLEWGNPPKSAEVILSTAKMNRVIEYAWADLTVTVEAGCTLQVLQNVLAEHGQRLACDCLWPKRATVGGVLSTNDTGALRLRFGGLRDLVIGTTLALADGTLASSGGRVVKNVAGYDLSKLATGAFGTLGVITRAVFRLHPLSRIAKSLSFVTQDFKAAQRHLFSIQDSQLAHTAFQLFCTRNARPRADILFEATDAGISAQELQLRKLLGPTDVEQSSETAWNARQEVFTGSGLIAKFSTLPSKIADTLEAVEKVANSHKLYWQTVVQATGIGTARLEGESDRLLAAFEQLRPELESHGGSLVVLRRPTKLDSLDAWGVAGGAVDLMRAVKKQLDAENTLNPGRFIGGI
jgi:glycolate oxidase FAD binding subunit